jgi:hypothetical protein
MAGQDRKWTTARRVRWLVVVAVVLLVAGGVAAVVLVQPDLSDARDRVDARWTPLRAPLAARYTALGGVAQTLTDAGAGERAVTKDLDAALARWSKLALRGDSHTDAGVEAATANELEALARRMRANVLASDKLKANAALTDAIAKYDQTIAPAPAIVAYNRSVQAYEDQREGAIHGFVARILGYDGRAQLVFGP